MKIFKSRNNNKGVSNLPNYGSLILERVRASLAIFIYEYNCNLTRELAYEIHLIQRGKRTFRKEIVEVHMINIINTINSRHYL